MSIDHGKQLMQGTHKSIVHRFSVFVKTQKYDQKIWVSAKLKQQTLKCEGQTAQLRECSH